MKTNKGNALTIIVIIIGLALVGWMVWGRSGIETSSLTSTSTPITQSSDPVAKINGKEIKLLVADTPESREKGLGGRDSLPEDTAMLFVFDVSDYYEFWMMDMKFPIDIIWLDENFKVVHIESNITPDTYPDETFISEDPAKYVIEANALFAQKNSLKVGDVVEVRLKK